MHNDQTTAFEKDIQKENPSKFSYLTKLWRLVFNSARLICGIYLGLSIILSILQPISALVWGRYIDKANIISDTFDHITIQLISLIGLALLFWFIQFLQSILWSYLYSGENIRQLGIVQSHHLQEKFHSLLLKKISKLYPDYMEVPRINDIIKRSFDSMGDEWSSLQRGVIIEGYVIIAKIISVIMVAASLYIFHPLLCLIVIIAPIPTLYTTYVGNKLQFKFSRDNSKIIREADYYQNTLLGSAAKEVKALNLFEFFYTKWKALADDYVVKERKNEMNIFLLGTVSGLISNIASAAADVFAVILLTQNRLSVGALGAVISLIGTLINSTSGLFKSIANFISKKNEAAQFFELIDLQEQDLISNCKQIKIEQMQTQNVSYRYPLTDEYRIKNVIFCIKKGEKVAFVGENGAGKTTFIKLLTGMLQPSIGDIFINNININDIDFQNQYSSLSYVFQEPNKFNSLTIADNVFLGDVTKERDELLIDKALSFSAFEGAEKNDLLGKDIGGTDLSGGQWQKIAIARAAYRDRDFIVLDEPTSNLDPLAEAEIFKKYIAMTKNKTVIMVTHRISVASLADRVVVFKDGEIVEDGTHENLLIKNGEYRRLYKTQSEWYDR